jgi:hypothetical protein
MPDGVWSIKAGCLLNNLYGCHPTAGTGGLDANHHHFGT